MRRAQLLCVCIRTFIFCKNAQNGRRTHGTLYGMNHQLIAQKLAALPSKRTFCKRHNLPPRTLWRIIAGHGNPLLSTLLAFDAALRKDAQQARKKGCE
jgi:hypothetical protein